jgi:hypothetical protein
MTILDDVHQTINLLDFQIVRVNVSRRRVKDQEHASVQVVGTRRDCQAS